MNLKNSKGMVLDGIACSQCVDSTGESLTISGIDISTLAVDGTINVEHMSADDGKVVPGEETIGKILHAHKVLKEDDCENDRERKYWKMVKAPYVYIVYRLYDGAGHRGAQAFAAQIRDAVAHGEKIGVRLSVEGSTLTRDKDDKNIITESVARRVSATLRPANRTCDVDVLVDPNAPKGYELSPAKADLLADIMDKGETVFEHPAYTRLGGSVEVECDPLIADPELQKTLSAGSYNAAPSQLTGGAALQVEDRGLRHKLRNITASYRSKPFNKTEFRALARAELPDVDDSFLDHFVDVAHDYHMKRLKKAEEEQQLQQQSAPEKARPKKAKHSVVAEDLQSRGIEEPKPEPEPEFDDKVEVAAPSGINLGADRLVQPQTGLAWKAPPPRIDPKRFAQANRQGKNIYARGAKATSSSKETEPASEPEKSDVWSPFQTPNPDAKIAGVGEVGKKNRLSLHSDGALQLPNGTKLELHIPNDEKYLSILHPDAYDITDEKRALYKRTVHEPWERAMSNWMELNKQVREGKVPRSIIKLAGLFSAMSPNTGVPLQERHWGHVMDMLHEGVMNIDQPVTEDHIKEFSRRAQGPNMPNWNNDYYNSSIPPEELPDSVRALHPEGIPRFPPPGVTTDEEAEERASKPNKFGNTKADLPQINGLRHLDDIMKHLEHLFATKKGDGRSMASALMNMKSDYKQKARKFGADEAKAMFEGVHPTVHGFGPKLARYMLTMAGAGNMLVPDRHMTRSLYNLAADDPMAGYLAESVVTQAKNEPFLAALDQHFFHKHPAVQYVLKKYPEHFKGHEEQAIFPAFWLHWLHIPHYERNQGRATAATIGGTDHKVFWDAVQDSMRHHGIPVRGEHYHYQPPDTSFNFGENVKKTEPAHPMAHLPIHARAMGAMQMLALGHGETGALHAYFAHVLPALRDAETARRRRDPHAVIRKAQALTINLRKAVDDIRAMKPVLSATHYFAGNPVQAGKAQTADGKYDLLHEDAEHYIAIPEGEDPAPHTLCKLPKSKEGTHFTVSRRPSVLVADLD